MMNGLLSEMLIFDLGRLYTSDFEVYGEKAQNSTDTEGEI